MTKYARCSCAHCGSNVTHVDSATRTHVAREAWVSRAIDGVHKAHVSCVYPVLMSCCDVRAWGVASESDKVNQRTNVQEGARKRVQEREREKVRERERERERASMREEMIPLYVYTY